MAGLPDVPTWQDQGKVFSGLGKPDLRAATLHLLLDVTSSYGDELILAYVVVGALVVSGLWMFFLSKRRTEMPERHPLCKALSQYGLVFCGAGD